MTEKQIMAGIIGLLIGITAWFLLIVMTSGPFWAYAVCGLLWGLGNAVLRMHNK